MIFSILESIKYVGHLYPVVLLRIFTGYYYIQIAYSKFHSDFLSRPRLAEQVGEVLPQLEAWSWYKGLVEEVFVRQWQVTAFALTGLELAIGFSYLLGYVVRPMGILGALLSCNLLLLLGTHSELSDTYRIFIVIHLTLSWVGAGRCLGVDYYFYKRRRGWNW